MKPGVRLGRTLWITLTKSSVRLKHHYVWKLCIENFCHMQYLASRGDVRVCNLWVMSSMCITSWYSGPQRLLRTRTCQAPAHHTGGMVCGQETLSGCVPVSRLTTTNVNYYELTIHMYLLTYLQVTKVAYLLVYLRSNHLHFLPTYLCSFSTYIGRMV